MVVALFVNDIRLHNTHKFFSLDKNNQLFELYIHVYINRCTHFFMMQQLVCGSSKYNVIALGTDEA